jgi:hypothetical protein
MQFSFNQQLVKVKYTSMEILKHERKLRTTYKLNFNILGVNSEALMFSEAIS